MKIEKGMQNLIDTLEGNEEVYTVTAANKILVEGGSVTYNKRTNEYTIKIKKRYLYNFWSWWGYRVFINKKVEGYLKPSRDLLKVY